jgi:hypothetical protein
LTASTDDVDVARVLIDGGADLDIPAGSIGTPLDNAIAYACWHVARLLIARGARVDKLWHAAALGLSDRMAELLEASAPSHDDLAQAFYQACAGGQRRAAQLLLAQGVDINASPGYAGACLDAASGVGMQRGLLARWLRTNGATPARH